MSILYCHFCKKKIGKNDIKFTRFNLAASKAHIPETMTSESRMCLDCFNEKKTIPEREKKVQDVEKMKKKSLFRPFG